MDVISEILLFFNRFLEAEYKAVLEYPVGVLGPANAYVKKTRDGWLKYYKQSDGWEQLKSGVVISSKKCFQSDIAQVTSEGYTRRENFS